MCDMRWTYCHCAKCFSPSTSLFPVSIFLPMLHTQLHLNTTLIGRTSGRSLGTSKYSNALSLLPCFKEFINVSFSSEYFVVSSAIQERKQCKYYNYKFACCFVWVLNLVSHLREEHRPREPENRVLREAVIRRREEVTGNWR